MLRVAVPNKGSLSEAATEMLVEAGYKQRRTTKDLTLTDSANEVEFYYLRPRDIAVYVGEGTLDVGISGRDLVLDSHADADVIMGLGFGSSTFRFAGRPGVADSVKDLGAAGPPGRERDRRRRGSSGRRGRIGRPAGRRGRDR
jgi:ATP phosphoribosyltransferase